MHADTSSGLLLRVRDRRNQHAWRRLVDLYSPLLTEWLRRYRLSPHDTEEVVQEVLLVLSREMPDFMYDPACGTFRGWLRTILANRVKAFLRTRSKKGVIFDSHHLEVLADPNSDESRAWDAEHDRHVAAHLLQAISSDFEPKTWTAFRRVVIGGETPSVVATDLGLSVNAIHQAKSRVLARLREEAAGLLDCHAFFP